MTDLIIHVFKDYINKKDIEGFKSYLLEIQEYDEYIPYDMLFQKIYIHACLKKYTPIIDFLKEKYEELDPITKIALRQVFAYGKYLQNR